MGVPSTKTGVSGETCIAASFAVVPFTVTLPFRIIVPISFLVPMLMSAIYLSRRIFQSSGSPLYKKNPVRSGTQDSLE